MKFLTPNQVVAAARQAAQAHHQGIFRRDGKTPYFDHVETVADIATSEWHSWLPHSARAVWNDLLPYVVAASYLHDTFEDENLFGIKLDEEALAKLGFPPIVGELVRIVTKRAGETYFDFIMRINESHPLVVGARIIKRADLTHNMSDLKEGAAKDKYRFAEYILTFRTGQ